MPLPFMKLWTNLLNMFKLMIRQRNLMPRVRTLIMRDLNTKSPIFVQSNVRVIPLYSLFHGRPHRSENAFSRVHQSEPSNGPEQWSLESWDSHNGPGNSGGAQSNAKNESWAMIDQILFSLYFCPSFAKIWRPVVLKCSYIYMSHGLHILCNI